MGCGLLVQIEDGAVRRVKGDPDHPANFGDVCAKAVHLPPTLTRGRLLFPEVRTRRDAERERVPWELALRTAADRLGEIFAVPFARPRRREELFDRPDYFWLRDAVLGFLESQAHVSA